AFPFDDEVDVRMVAEKLLARLREPGDVRAAVDGDDVGPARFDPARQLHVVFVVPDVVGKEKNMTTRSADDALGIGDRSCEAWLEIECRIGSEDLARVAHHHPECERRTIAERRRVVRVRLMDAGDDEAIALQHLRVYLARGSRAPRFFRTITASQPPSTFTRRIDAATRYASCSGPAGV